MANEKDNAEVALSKDHLENLSHKQLRAIKLLTEGRHEIQTIAENLGITRQRLWQWRNKDEDFKKAYKSKSREIQVDSYERIRNTLDDAVNTLIRATREGDTDSAEKLIELFGDAGEIRERLQQYESGGMVVDDPLEERLVRTLRENLENRQLFKYLAMLLEQRDSEEVIQTIQEELNIIEVESSEKNE